MCSHKYVVADKNIEHDTALIGGGMYGDPNGPHRITVATITTITVVCEKCGDIKVDSKYVRLKNNAYE